MGTHYFLHRYLFPFNICIIFLTRNLYNTDFWDIEYKYICGYNFVEAIVFKHFVRMKVVDMYEYYNYTKQKHKKVGAIFENPKKIWFWLR